MPSARRIARRRAELNTFPLFSWFLGELGFDDWEAVRSTLSDPAFEERAHDGSSGFVQVLLARHRAARIPYAVLTGYDAAILSDWDTVVRNRLEPWGRPRLKYFQYLCLLAIEHFLTYRRDDETALLRGLNSVVPDAFDQDDLRKVAISIATGAGKTLISHVNFKQWLRIVGTDAVDGVILVTPSEILSAHHLEQLRLSGIDAAIFDPEVVSLFDSDRQVKIIDINKFREEQGTKTVAVESFGTRNLVLIDEAHRGSRSEDRVWKDYRDRLSRDGYAFEYSATFRQAVAASGDVTLAEEYEKAIVFDYPYREFYNDGFGKDFRVRNAEFPDDSEEAALYFVAALLIFFQQQIAFTRDAVAARQSSIEPPLMLAVGTTVQRADSDVENVLLRIRDFIEERQRSVDRIRRLLDQSAALVSTDGQPLVFNDLDLLRSTFPTAEGLYDALRERVFHSGPGGAVRVTRFVAAQGEVRVSVDAGEPFGLINVGDAASLFSHLTSTLNFVGEEQSGTASDAIFESVSKPASRINILIGARKFMEGWDSNRPSCMLLLNIGRSEGTQVIQLFGRGVRLRGFEGSLMRSSRDLYRPPAPKELPTLETLEIFGIRADYIRRFKGVLEIEGIRRTFDASRTIRTTLNVPSAPALKILRTEGKSFSEEHPEVTFDPAADAIRVALDWYPRVLSYSSLDGDGDDLEKRTASLGPNELTFVDMDRVYAAMLAYKRSRRWSNAVINRSAVPVLFAKADWYTLYASQESLRPAGLGSIRTWQSIAESLACAYLSEWYRRRLREHEAKRLTIQELGPTDPTVVTEYVVHYDGGDVRVGEILDGAPRRTGDALEILRITQSCYEPLLYVADRDACATVPMALVKSERDFVSDVIRFVGSGGIANTGTELYLLRNASRGRGMGFAEAENFHPDFVLWFCKDDVQVVMFVEPHGLAHEVLGFQSPKVAFSKTVREIEDRLADPRLKLDASIVSPTSRSLVRWASDAKQSELAEHNIFFFEDRDYIDRLMSKGLTRLQEFGPT